MINNEKINMFYMTRTSVMCGAMWTRILRHTYTVCLKSKCTDFPMD
jgi:hypothetical protein